MSLSRNKLKYIRSLRERKYRNEHKTFVAEGNKLVKDLLPYIRCQLLVSTPEFLEDVDTSMVEEVIEVKASFLSQASSQQSPQQAIAVFYQRQAVLDIDFDNELVLALDGVQDPGNLGTIIRLADWYGIKHIFCSADTVDVYNPKVVQATMGALARVNTHYTDLNNWPGKHKDIPVYGTFLDGKNIYEEELSSNGIIIMGNEGNGIRSDIEKQVTKKLYIPGYSEGNPFSESLNVAIATAIVCAEFRRRII